MNPLTKKLFSWGVGGVIAVSAGYVVAPFEGMSNQAYKDIVGVATICFGETKGVKMGDYRTTEQCEKGLAKELSEYNKSMRKHVTVNLLPYEEVAYTSFVWNLGETNFKNSTLLKKLNAGDRAGACAELLRWNKADGRVVKGLDNRRKFEYEVCMGKNTEVNKALEAVKQP